MTTRRGTPADAEVIAAIEAAAAHRPWALADVRSHLSLSGRVTLVVGEAVEGHVLASAVADEGEVLTMAVHPSARRRGMGRRLLRALFDEWRARGVRTGWLEVRKDNVAACALYRSEGWLPSGRRKGYYSDGVDALTMRREVRP